MQDVSFIFLYLGWLSSILEPEGRDATFKRVTRKLLISFPILGFSVRFSQGSHQENGEYSKLTCGGDPLIFRTSYGNENWFEKSDSSRKWCDSV